MSVVNRLVLGILRSPAHRLVTSPAFRRPRTVTVRQAGRVWTGIGRTIHPDHPASRAAGEAYARARHVTPATNDRIVLIDPVAIKERPCTSSPGLRSPSPS